MFKKLGFYNPSVQQQGSSNLFFRLVDSWTYGIYLIGTEQWEKRKMSLAVAEWRAGHWGEVTPMGRWGWNPRLLIWTWTAVLFSGASSRDDVLKTMATVVAGQHFGPTYFAAFSCSEQSSDKREMIKLFDPVSQDLRKIPAFPSWAIYCAAIQIQLINTSPWHKGKKKKKQKEPYQESHQKRLPEQ